jgi:putative transposase
MKKIDPAKGWYSPQELAGIPGLPGTYSAVIRAAKKNLWASRTKVRGKGLEYAVRSLPAETQAAIVSLAHDLVASAPALPVAVDPEKPAKTPPSPPAPLPVGEGRALTVALPAGAVAVRGQVRRGKEEGALTDAERAYRGAALVLCRAVEGALAATGLSLKACCGELAARLVAGNASDDLLRAAALTYLKPRPAAGPLGGVAALVSRLQRLMAFFEQGRLAGDVGRFLIPGKREKEGHNPLHVACFLRFYCLPTRPPVSEAYRNMRPWLAERGLEAPSYAVVCRIEHELPVTVKYRGRVTGSEWRSLKPYVDRDVSAFKANDLWVGDGHSFKAKVQHPIHGQPFTPEITVILDWVSRKVVGWSASLSESTVAVSDAFRHAQMTTRARPLVYYSDNGSGQTGKMIDCPIAGTLARQGIAHETGIPGNPQGRGIIERLWQVTLIPLARSYPTCTWRGADENATTKMLKLLNRKDQGGVAIPTFRQLLDGVAACFDRYNLEHAHRELGGLTPEDEYQARLDKDSIVFGPGDAEIAALWMPEVVRTPARGLVSLFGNVYFKRDLPDLLREGEKVRVRYDLHDPNQVLLLTLDGRMLGPAAWNGNREAAFPVPRIEQLRGERAAGKVRRGEEIIAEAQAELGQVYDLTPAVPMPVEQPDYMPQALPEEAEEDLMPHQDVVRWLYGKQPDDGEDEDFEAAAG